MTSAPQVHRGQPEVYWYPIPWAEDADARAAWTVDMAGEWAKNTWMQVDEESIAAARSWFVDVVAMAPSPGFTAQFLCQPTPGAYLPVEFAYVVAPDADWAEAHRESIATMSAGATRVHQSSSEIPDVRASLALALYELGEIDGEKVVQGRQFAIARVAGPDGPDIDVIAHAASIDLSLIEAAQGPILSFLHGPDVIQGVRAE